MRGNYETAVCSVFSQFSASCDGDCDDEDDTFEDEKLIVDVLEALNSPYVITAIYGLPLFLLLCTNYHTGKNGKLCIFF